jgi:hypothetical protein
MVPDCIDPKVGSFLNEIMKKSIPENVADCSNEYDFGEVWEARLHWSGCPACRPEFAVVPAVFKQIGVGLEKKWSDALSDCRDDFLAKKASLLAAACDVSNVCPEIIAELAMWESDVGSFLCHGQEVLSLRVPIGSDEEGIAWPGEWEPNLSGWREFIGTLEPGVQRFVYDVMFSHDLLTPVREKLISEYAEVSRCNYDFEASRDLQRRMEAAIENSQLQPDSLLSIIETASIAYSIVFGGSFKAALTTVAQSDLPPITVTTQETRGVQGVLQEWKRDFDNFEDSMKAGQMELMRLIEHNRRPAAAYEPYISAQLGAPLYALLQEKTQRALQLSEYLYAINQEPDGFSLTALAMAQGYENELLLRVVWPFVEELLAAGTRTYDAQGKSKDRPLIRRGKFPKTGATLGNLGWYLKNDPTMRSKVLALGLDVEAISKDVASVGKLRNKPAHDFGCDRAVADNLRQLILCSNGVLSRLHPMAPPTR